MQQIDQQYTLQETQLFRHSAPVRLHNKARENVKRNFIQQMSLLSTKQLADEVQNPKK